MLTQPSFSVLRWTVFTSIGFIAGVALLVFLSALLEPLKLDDYSIIGFSLALTVGLMQWLLLRKHLKNALNWVWLYIAGVVIPLLLLAELLKLINFKSEFIFLPMILVGALFTGYLQYRFLLKGNFNNAKRWTFYSFLGWAAAVVITLTMLIPLLLGLPINGIFKILNLIALILSGPAIGIITGVGMASVLKGKNP